MIDHKSLDRLRRVPIGNSACLEEKYLSLALAIDPMKEERQAYVDKVKLVRTMLHSELLKADAILDALAKDKAAREHYHE